VRRLARWYLPHRFAAPGFVTTDMTAALPEAYQDLERLDRLEEVERCARGLVRTAHPAVGEREVSRPWWDALCRALEEAS
jgi:hypothetical protein